MKNWRDRFGLRQFFILELDMMKGDFINRLQRIVDHGSTGMFSDPFEAFSSSENIYKGEVHSSGFKIKRRKRMFDFNHGSVLAIGSIKQENDKIIINTEISGVGKGFIFFYILLIAFYLIFIGIAFFLPSEGSGGLPLFVIPFILLHAVFMLGIPFMIMKKSVARTKYDLEREFFYLTRKG